MQDVQSLIAQVRSVLDEANSVNISDTNDILPALNRAQDVASNILARHYESPLLKEVAMTLTSGEAEYDIPEDAFENRLEKVEVQVNGFYYPIERVSYRDSAVFETPSPVSIPNYYTEIGRKFKLLPSPTATYPLRVWYLQEPPPLVKNAGRVIKIGDDYITLDEVDTTILSSDITSRESYFNIIDEQTGTIKATLQIKAIAGNRITIKTSPTRDTVWARDVSAVLPADLALDDLICSAEGSCISYFKKPFSNYMVQYAIFDMRTKMGEQDALASAAIVKKELETLVERSWVGRPQTLRVKRSSRNWMSNPRRFWGQG